MVELMSLPFAPSAFGTDHNQELYILQYGNNGKIYKLDRSVAGAPEPPALLSQTGVFTSLNPLTPDTFLIPYEQNAPFWSDGAIKTRWMIIPNDGTHDTPAEKISYSENGNWIFPQGAVLIKHFELPVDETNASITKKIETRFLIHGNDGNYYGMTYRWNNAGTEAFLLPNSRTDTLTITTASGPRTIEWYYPGRGECLSCHNTQSDGTLGPLTRQLNGNTYYPVTGRTANQLKTLTHLDIFDTPPDTNNLGALMTSKAADDLSASLEERARTYLDANCASCHQPGTGVDANFDARMQTSLANQNLIYGGVQLDLGIHDARVIIPGQNDRSVLMERLNSVHTDFAMPQLAKNLIDTAGVQLISDWIASINPNFGSTLQGQTISFATLPNKVVGDPAFTLTASTSSGLPISYSVTSGPATVAGNTVTLSGGTGKVIIRAEQTGNATFDAAPGVEQAFWVTPPASGTGSGLLANYFNNMDFTSVALTRTDPTIDFYWGSGRPDPAVNYETFSVKWEGEIEATYNETFTFTTSSDDGVRLWIDNQLIIDQWNDQGVTEFTGSIAMTAWQRVPITMEYYQNQVYASAKLMWSSPSLAKEVVPTEFLYPETGVLDANSIVLEASQSNQSVQLDWFSQSSTPIDRILVERSLDGREFDIISNREENGLVAKGKEFSDTDKQPALGSNYYRVREIYQDGSQSLSNVQEVHFQPDIDLKTYPNPVQSGEMVQIQLLWPYTSAIKIHVLNLMGQSIYEQHFETATNPGLLTFDIPTSTWSQGIYLIDVQAEESTIGSSKIVVRE